jgi:hypothetical protein
MAAYTLIHINLNDPQSYDPVGLPSAGDSVNGNGVTARGNLTTGSVSNFILTNGDVQVGSADSVTIGNPSGTGGTAAMAVDENVTTNAVVWSNGSLTADTIQGPFNIHGGTITLRLGYDTSAGLFSTVDGGTLNIGGLFTGATTATGNSTISVSHGATVTTGGLSLGVGQTIISMQSGSTFTVAGIGPLTLDSATGSQFEIDGGSKFEANGYDLVVRGAKGNNSPVRLDGGQAQFRSLSVEPEGQVRLVSAGGTLTIDNDVTDNGVIEVTGSVFKAANLTLGNATWEHDDRGRWTLKAGTTATTGLLPIADGGYVSIGSTLTLNNADNSGLQLSSGSLDVGGDHGPVVGQARVSEGGTIIGHGEIASITLINDGLVEAKDGTVEITGDQSGSGHFEIDDAAVLKFDGASTGEMRFLSREDAKLGDESMLWFEQPEHIDRSNLTVTGLQVGDTIVMDGRGLLANLMGLEVHTCRASAMPPLHLRAR